MSRVTKRSNYFILSSDSDSSENENPPVRRKFQVTTNENEDVQNNVNNESQSLNRDVNQSANDHRENNNLNEEQSNDQQTRLDDYLNNNEDDGSFDRIDSLFVNKTNLSIRGKVIQRSRLRTFQNTNKVFHGFICDNSSEVKVVAFNQDADRLFDLFALNNILSIKNGIVKTSDINYRSAYSIYEIVLSSESIVEIYSSPSFHPMMQMTRKNIIDLFDSLQGVSVDIEGVIVQEREINQSASASTNDILRRKTIKVKDDSGQINLTLWNDKILELPMNIINKRIRLRNGKINHYNDYVSINISDSSMMEIIE